MSFNEIRSILNLTVPTSDAIHQIHTLMSAALETPLEDEMLAVWLPYTVEALKAPKFQEIPHILNFNALPRPVMLSRSPLDVLYNGYRWATPRLIKSMRIDLTQVKHLHCWPELLDDVPEMPNLQTLSFKFPHHDRRRDTLRQLPYMPRLRTLDMGEYRVHEDAFATLAKSPLESFESNCFLQTAEHFNAYHWPELTHLRVGPNFGAVTPEVALNLRRIALQFPTSRGHAMLFRDSGAIFENLEMLTFAHGGHSLEATHELLTVLKEYAPNLTTVCGRRSDFPRIFPLIRRVKELGATFTDLVSDVGHWPW